MKILKVENGEVKLRSTLTDLQSLEKLLNICLEDGEIWRVGDTLTKSMNLVPHYEEEVCAKIQHHIFDIQTLLKALKDHEIEHVVSLEKFRELCTMVDEASPHIPDGSDMDKFCDHCVDLYIQLFAPVFPP